MAGLLSAFAGAAKGYGDAMIDQAKQRREDVLAALVRSNQVEDRDAGFAQRDKEQTNLFAHDDTSQTAQFGQQKTISQMQIDAAAANARLQADTSVKTAGMAQAGENSRQAAGFADEANQFGNFKTLQDGTLVGISKTGQAQQIVDKSGAPVIVPQNNVPASVASAIFASHTTVDPDTKEKTVDTDAALADLAKASKQYATGPTTTVPTSLSTGTMPGAGVTGLTSNLFGGNQALSTLSVMPTPPPAAINFLKQNPESRSAFDQKYGQGAAARALGQ